MKNTMSVFSNDFQVAIIAAGLKTTQDLENASFEATKKLESEYRQASRELCQNPNPETIKKYQELRHQVSPKLWARF